MKVVVHKQNTKSWRSWRGMGIGASDAPAIMGESPWCTPFQLWLQKTGTLERTPANEFQVAAMKRGVELEPKIRAWFEKQTGVQFTDIAGEHDEYEFIRCSLDGYNPDYLGRVCNVEIKAGNKEDHERALSKKEIPKKYYPQVQAQLMISGAAVCYYVSYYEYKDLEGKPTDSYVVVEVYPDPDYQQKLLAAMIDFWHRVTQRVLPDVTAEEVNKLVQEQQKALERANNIAKVLAMVSESK